MLKIGDRITIRSDLVDEQIYGVEIFIEDCMSNYCGEVAEIVEEGTIWGSWYLDIDDKQYAWTEEMFEMEKTIKKITVPTEPITDWQEAFLDMVTMMRLVLKDNDMVNEMRDQIITKRTK